MNARVWVEERKHNRKTEQEADNLEEVRENREYLNKS